MALLNFRPWLTLIAAVAVSAGAILFGYPVENGLLGLSGLAWPSALADVTALFGTYAIMLVAAMALGIATGVRVLAAGRSPVVNGTLGLGLGMALVALAVSGSFAAGSAIFSATPPAPQFAGIAVATLIFLLVAIGEEALFRGWAQPLIARYWGGDAAVVATAIAFAFAHNFGLDASNRLIIDVNPFLVNVNLLLGGLVMGLLAQRFGGIAAAIAFHFGWNWADYFLFALTPNPGRFSFGTLLDVDLGGAAQLGGISEGLMANIFATLILIVMIVALFLYARSDPVGSKPAGGKPKAPEPKKVPEQAGDAQSAPLAAVAQPVVEPGPAPDETKSIPSDAKTLLMFGNEEAQTSEESTGSLTLVQSATHQGCVRELNEDRFWLSVEAGIFVVADGMGGHKFGDRASTIIIEHVAAAAKPGALDERVAAIAESVRQANRAIYDEAQGNGSRMGSTVVSLLIDERRYAIVWAGDSRAYRLRNGEVERLTKDHTQVQEMVERGLLQPQDVARHPMSHVLVRAVGVNPEFDLDEVRGEIEAGDVYFLCSDGIYDVLEEDEIGALLAKAGKIDAMEKMISMALDLGARDNVTGIIVRPATAG